MAQLSCKVMSECVSLARRSHEHHVSNLLAQTVLLTKSVPIGEHTVPPNFYTVVPYRSMSTVEGDYDSLEYMPSTQLPT